MLARAGDIEHAQELANELQRQNPLNTKIVGYWLPTIRAAIELSRHHPAKAIAILEEAAPYELGMPGPQPELGALFYPPIFADRHTWRCVREPRRRPSLTSTPITTALQSIRFLPAWLL